MGGTCSVSRNVSGHWDLVIFLGFLLAATRRELFIVLGFLLTATRKPSFFVLSHFSVHVFPSNLRD
jgi:hypothetical protein